MERLIKGIIFIVVFAAGGATVWLLKGFRTSLYDEIFSERNKLRNSLIYLLLIAVLIYSIIYINNPR